MILDEGCAERGCPMHDERETKGVEFIRKEWVGLTVDELIDLERKHLSHENLTQAIEAKLREKNT